MIRRLALPVLALALLAAACSRIDLGWRLAPWLLEREATQWLDLDKAERQAFGQDLRAWLNQNAARVAPRLAGLSRVCAEDLRRGHDAQALDALYAQVPRLWDQCLEPAVPLLAGWLLRDPGRRAAALRRAFDERNNSDLKRWATHDRAEADREKRLRSGLKDWLGDLTPAQEEGVRAWAHEADYPVDGWKADRLRRQQELIAAMLATPPDPAAVREELRQWWLRPELDRDPAYHRSLLDYRKRQREAGQRLLDSLSPAQRERVVQRLDALAEDLDAIARKSSQN